MEVLKIKFTEWFHDPTAVRENRDNTLVNKLCSLSFKLSQEVKQDSFQFLHILCLTYERIFIPTKLLLDWCLAGFVKSPCTAPLDKTEGKVAPVTRASETVMLALLPVDLALCPDLLATCHSCILSGRCTHDPDVALLFIYSTHALSHIRTDVLGGRRFHRLTARSDRYPCSDNLWLSFWSQFVSIINLWKSRNINIWFMMTFVILFVLFASARVNKFCISFSGDKLWKP